MARLTRNSYKRKIVLFGIFIFASIALISTGFAAWVMSTNAKESTKPGNVSVGEVKESNLKITEISLDGTQFVFEPSKGDNQGRVRVDLDADETKAYESLSVTLTATVSPKKYLGSLTIKLSVVETDAEHPTKFTDGIKKAVELNYIVLPECFSETGKVITFSGSDDAPEYNVNETIAFAWGAAFQVTDPMDPLKTINVNPSLYYDNYEEGLAVEDETVKKTLENLRACIYGYYDELNASGANRETIIESHKADTAPQFIITIEAKTN